MVMGMETDMTLSWSNCVSRDMLDPPRAEVRLFWEDYADAMAVDALAPCVAKSSTVMLLSS